MTTYKHKIVVLFLSLLLYQMSFAQNKVTTAKNQIKFHPFKLIDLVNPGIEFSLERQVGKRSSTQLSYSYMTDLFGVTGYSDYAGNRFGIEQKYFVQQAVSDKPYFSVELLRANVKYNNEMYFGYKPVGTDSVLYTYPDSIHLERTTIAFNIKAGRQFFIKQFVFDLSIGVGLKHRNVVHSNRLIPSDEMDRPRHPNAYYMAEAEGKSFTLDVPIVFRVGYSF
jgi:hypothetical protein